MKYLFSTNMTTVHNIKQMADTIYHEAINNSTAN